jgi:hypothetical protein
MRLHTQTLHLGLSCYHTSLLFSRSHFCRGSLHDDRISSLLYYLASFILFILFSFLFIQHTFVNLYYESRCHDSLAIKGSFDVHTMFPCSTRSSGLLEETMYISVFPFFMIKIGYKYQQTIPPYSE